MFCLGASSYKLNNKTLVFEISHNTFDMDMAEGKFWLSVVYTIAQWIWGLIGGGESYHMSIEHQKISVWTKEVIRQSYTLQDAIMLQTRLLTENS